MGVDGRRRGASALCGGSLNGFVSRKCFADSCAPAASGGGICSSWPAGSSFGFVSQKRNPPERKRLGDGTRAGEQVVAGLSSPRGPLILLLYPSCQGLSCGGDSDTETGALAVRAGKGRKDRMAYATNGGREALLDWLELRGNAPGALFCPVNKGGNITIRPVTEQSIFYVLKRRGEEAGVKSFSPHDMRRTLALSLQPFELLTVETDYTWLNKAQEIAWLLESVKEEDLEYVLGQLQATVRYIKSHRKD